jgi:putative addiction module killer protein
MYIIQQSDTFIRWLTDLRDVVAKAAILRRLNKAHQGHLGDVKPIDDGICEMRFFVGAGYRAYYIINNGTVLLLLCGGDKSSQKRDIKLAKTMLKEMKEVN